MLHHTMRLRDVVVHLNGADLSRSHVKEPAHVQETGEADAATLLFRAIKTNENRAEGHLHGVTYSTEQPPSEYLGHPTPQDVPLNSLRHTS